MMLAVVSPTEPHQPGLKAYKKGFELFERHQFRAAFPLLKEAYQKSGHRPSTIKALALCEWQLKMYSLAIKHFEEYLETDKGKEEAGDIEVTLTVLRELRDTPIPSPDIVFITPTRAERQDDSIWSSWWLWSLVGGVAIGATSVALWATSNPTPSPTPNGQLSVNWRFLDD